MSEHSSGEHIPTPSTLHTFNDLKSELLKDAGSEEERQRIEQTFDPGNAAELDEINQAGLSPEDHREMFEATFPAFDAVMDRYLAAAPETDPVSKPGIELRFKALLDTAPRTPDRKTFPSPTEAGIWYEELGVGMLPNVNEADLLVAARTASGEKPTYESDRAYRHYAECQLDAGCILMEVAEQEALRVGHATKRQQECLALATTLFEKISPAPFDKDPLVRREADLARICGMVYAADIVARSNEHQAIEMLLEVDTRITELEARYGKLPGTEATAVGLRTELAMHMLLLDVARRTSTQDKVVRVHKGYMRQDKPFTSSKKANKFDFIVSLTGRDEDGEMFHSEFGIQAKTQKQDTPRTPEDYGKYGGGIDLLELDAQAVHLVIRAQRQLMRSNNDPSSNAIAGEILLKIGGRLDNQLGLSERIAAI